MIEDRYYETFECRCGVHCLDLDGELFEIDPLDKCVFRHKCEVE